MPVLYPEAAGKPYRPSNGTEGQLFEGHWCDKCQRDRLTEYGCDIRTSAHCFSVGDAGYPEQWKFDERGAPICTAFVHLDDEPPPLEEPRCNATLDLFEGSR